MRSARLEARDVLTSVQPCVKITHSQSFPTPFRSPLRTPDLEFD
jgi:hypothetical protein